MTDKNIDTLFKGFHVRSKHPAIDKILENERNNGINERFYDRSAFSKAHQRTELNLKNIMSEISASFNR